MKEFFKQCLKDLEALAGKRQLAFWEIEAAKSEDAKKEGDRLIKVCIEGMLFACQDFTFIPDDHKKRIIREQMVKDAANYDALNGATVYKWLARAATAYRTHSQFSESDLTPRDKDGNPTEAAPDEVGAKYLKELENNLAVGHKVPQMTKEEIELEGQDRPLKDPALNELRRQIGTQRTPRQKFVIEGIEIMAVSQEEAQKAFDAIFK